MQLTRRPGIPLLIVRVVVITLIITLLAFAVSLFLGIAGIVLVDMIRGGGVNLTLAYRHVALPIAMATLVVAFSACLTVELRHYRRERAAAISERRPAA